MKHPFRLSALFLFAALAPVAHAQFVGDYALTPPSGQDFLGNTTAGNWSFTLTPVGTGDGSFDTTSAPASFTMEAVASGTANSANSTLAYLSIPQAGTISFDFNFDDNFSSGTGGIANFSYSQNGVPVVISSNLTGTGSWNVHPGDSITFSTFAQGGVFGGFFPEQTQSAVTISNFSFSAIPEPADFGIGAGLLAIGAAAWRRRVGRA